MFLCLKSVIIPKIPLFGKERLGEIFVTLCEPAAWGVSHKSGNPEVIDFKGTGFPIKNFGNGNFGLLQEPLQKINNRTSAHFNRLGITFYSL